MSEDLTDKVFMRKQFAKAARNTPTFMPGVVLIRNERRRQMAEEGWTPEHDDEHDTGELASAAACYAKPPELRERIWQASPDATGWTTDGWPWDPKWWKPAPDDRVRELIKAGALIAAEIDRLLREEHDDSKVSEGHSPSDPQSPHGGTTCR